MFWSSKIVSIRANLTSLKRNDVDTSLILSPSGRKRLKNPMDPAEPPPVLQQQQERSATFSQARRGGNVLLCRRQEAEFQAEWLRGALTSSGGRGLMAQWRTPLVQAQAERWLMSAQMMLTCVSTLFGPFHLPLTPPPPPAVGSVPTRLHKLIEV